MGVAENRDALCLIKFKPIHRMIGTSLSSTGPNSFLTVTSSSVTFVVSENMSPLATWMTLAFNCVSSVVFPTSKSGEGRMGSPRRTRPSVDSKRIRRFQFGDMAINVLQCLWKSIVGSVRAFEVLVRGACECAMSELEG